MRGVKEAIKYYDDIWEKGLEDKVIIGWGYEQRRLHSTIFEFLNIKENDPVLEIGCGRGDLTEKLSKKYKRIIAFDISSVGVKKAREQVDVNCNSEFLVADATKLPFDSDQFDVVILSEVLEHVIDQEGCIQEIHRVIKPNGWFMLTTPNSGGIHRNMTKISCKLLRKPYSPHSNQIIDNPLSPSELRQMLLPYFTIEKKRSVYYAPPYLQMFDSQRLINLSNRISEFIEKRNLLSDFGLYQCLLCRARESVD